MAEPAALSAPRRGLDPALAAAVLSGAAALIAEACWIRRAALAFGSTLHAVTAVVAVFMLGLALGAAAAGARAGRLRSPLRVYAGVEALLAAMLLVSLPAFDAAENLYGVLFRATEANPGVRLAARVALVAALLSPPSFLMGATLPLLVRARVRDPGGVGRGVGALYALNTLGAALGCAVAGLALVPGLGLARSLALAAGLGAVAALLAWSAARREAPAPAAPAAGAPRPALDPRLPAAALALAGCAALGLEVVWTRFLPLVVRQTVATETIALAVVLAGIVLGSAAAARIADRPGWAGPALAATLCGAGLTALLLLRQPPGFWERWGGGPLAAFVLLLPPAALSGAAFPLGVRLAAGPVAAAAPAAAGTLAALNTAGGIAGACLAGFVLVPALGLEAAARILSAVPLAAGVAVWVAWAGRRGAGLALAPPAAALAAWLALQGAGAARLPADFLAPAEQRVAWREGREANLAVVRRGAALELEIDRWWQGRDRPTHQVMAAHLPLALHGAARRVLVIGAGAGQTPAAMLLHRPAELTVADIEPAVFEVIADHFGGAWLSDPRVRIVTGDGRELVVHGRGTWDVVSLEVGQPARPGVGAFYTAEFYRALGSRLAPGGIVSQFVPLAFLTPATFRAVIATFVAEFPAATLWYNTSELLLIGARDSLVPDPARLEALAADPALGRGLDLALWGGVAHRLDQPGAFGAAFLAGPGGLARLAHGAPRLSDDRPWLEREARRAAARATGEEAVVRVLRAHLDPLPAGFHPAAGPWREENLRNLEAAPHRRRAEAARERGDLGAAIAAATTALAAHPLDLESRRIRGDAALRRSDLERAVADFAAVIAAEPGDAEVRRALATALHRGGRLGEAIPHYRAALAATPGDPEIHNNLGAALAESGDPGAAVVHFERAAALRPGYAEADANLRRAREALRR